ncbi:hypothetical protein LY622_04815 [Halomonas sp. M5N1S17]|uniref:hypothetical protein n=1 Tax=Halomonas alkalisoli TaxID=2907158 RepID=UPI001F4086AC|nr:hypothetical protein [Halomonas alkalisoli]MCE9662755.1 hypothetical protein [Halomonas alkalisoli]
MKIKRAVKRRIDRLLGRPTSHRRFISSDIGVQGFLEILKDNNIRYVVLRWFESLPTVQTGEDIDILVADEDVKKLTSLLTVAGNENDTPCDIYSVSGLSGTNSHGLPYYPPSNAKSILDNALLLNGIARVPGPDEHFLSLSYHAVYRKGYLSGIPSRDPTLNVKVISPRDHDYVGEIKKLHEHSSYRERALDITLEGVDALLAECRWRPLPDVLKEMARRNEWIREALVTSPVAQ